MTFPASGQIADFGAELSAELRQSLPITLPSDETRWLAEVPSGPMVIPTDFYSKSAVKLVAEYGHGTLASSFSQSSVNFGPEYAGRRIIVIFHVAVNASVFLNMSSVQIGGVAGSGNNHGSGDVNNSAGVGIYMANPSGTSGTISFSTANNCRAYIRVLSVAGITSRHDYDWSTNATNPGASVQIDIPANGVLIAAYTRYATGAHAYTGVDERDSNLFQLSSARASYAWTNRLGVQSNRTVASSPGGSLGQGFMAASFT